MPKMKVLETGQATEEVVTMSWSPKMDLLALGNRKGCVHLHRLSWQKVWQTQLTMRGGPAIPELMTWHPEGLFLIISSDSCTFVIDVECGKIVHSHELPVQISTMKWCTSQYRHSMKDVLASQSKQADYLRNDLKIQRVETNLSMLFLGTINGYVYIYTGGFLLGLCLLACEQGYNNQVLQIDASPSLDAFQFLTDEESGSDEVILSISHFTNEHIPRIAPIIEPLGLKYILFLKNWAMIQNEMSSLNEHWGRLVDLYNNYMTFGGTKDLEVARVDYLELLLTGITCVEMELYLGDGGREKEAKKNTNAINTANASITEHLRTIKCCIVNLLTELNEIGGFLKQISGYEKATNLIIEIRKSCNYMFLAMLHIQSLVHNFVEISLQFMHMITNTIHSFNVQEAPDFIEEDADTDKVLEFLETTVDKDVFQFLLKNATLGYSSKAQDKTKKRVSPFGELNFPEKNALGLPKEDAETRDFFSFPELIRDALTKHGHTLSKHSVLMDLSEEEVSEFLSNLVPTMNKLTKNLLGIPVLCSIPFEADTHQITKLSKSIYFDQQYNEDIYSDKKPNPVLRRKPFQMFMDSSNSKTTLKCLWTSKKLLFFELDFQDSEKATIRSLILNFTSPVIASKLFSDTHVTVVSHQPIDKPNESPKSIVCQVHYRNLLSKAVSVSVDFSQSKSKCSLKSVLPTVIQIEVPLEITKPCLPTSSTFIDYALPLEGLVPLQLNVSGHRKVGAVLAENRRTVLLLEMETDINETSFDDTADASDDSEDGNSNSELIEED